MDGWIDSLLVLVGELVILFVILLIIPALQNCYDMTLYLQLLWIV